MSNGLVDWAIRADRVGGTAVYPKAWRENFVHIPEGWREAQRDEIIDEDMRWTPIFSQAWNLVGLSMIGQQVGTFYRNLLADDDMRRKGFVIHHLYAH